MFAGSVFPALMRVPGSLAQLAAHLPGNTFALLSDSVGGFAHFMGRRIAFFNSFSPLLAPRTGTAQHSQHQDAGYCKMSHNLPPPSYLMLGVTNRIELSLII